MKSLKELLDEILFRIHQVEEMVGSGDEHEEVADQDHFLSG